jgi:tetratricopeptide (TPR) repeat protein
MKIVWGVVILGLAASMAADRAIQASLRAERSEDLAELNRLRAALAAPRPDDYLKARAQIESAAEEIFAYVARRPVHVQGIYARASAYYALEDFARARYDLQRVVAMDPAMSPAWDLMGRILIEEYRRGFYSDGASPDQPLIRARRQLALEAFERASGAPISGWGLTETRDERIGDVLRPALKRYATDGDPREAREMLVAEFAREPSSEVANWIGLLSETNEENVKWQIRSIDLAPVAARPYLDRGVALFSAKRFRAAWDDLRRVTWLSPRWADLYAARGRVLQGMSRDVDAIPEFEGALQLSTPDWPDRAGVERRLARLRP